MNYMAEDNSPISAYDPECVNHKIFSYRPYKKGSKEEDFFLGSMSYWENLTGMVYTVSIGGNPFDIASGLFVMIGDEYGDFDWIEIEELIGRTQLTVMTFDPSFRQWNISPMNVLDAKDDQSLLWPSPLDEKAKGIIPIISNNTVILVSEKDQHSKMQHYQVEVFTGNRF